MKDNARSKRIQRRHRFTKPATIQLTSLIDILTVLVFFLLVNSQNVTQIPGAQNLVLPKSTADKRPNDVLTITVNTQSIVVQGVKIEDSATAMADKADDIQKLYGELKFRSAQTPPGKDGQREVLILGDKGVPYTLLRKVMFTCSDASYSKISFGVLRTKEGGL